MQSPVYSESFYDQTTAGSLSAARQVLPLLWKRRAFESVIDVGCGVGTWLLAASELGASHLLGIDGPYVPKDRLLLGDHIFRWMDFTGPISLSEQYELCICLEVAEHLPPSRAVTFVEDLTRLSSVVAFSAAIPFQGGDGHLNEIWPEYWARLFRQRDFLPWTEIRALIWHCCEIPWWYRQNLIIYVKAAEWENFLPGQTPASLDTLTIIHPESYLWNVRRPSGQLTTTYMFDVDAYHQCASGTLEATPGYGPEFPAPRPGSETTSR
jgi:hypothetical protein